MKNVYSLGSVKVRKIVSIFLTLNFLFLEIPTVFAETTFGHEIELVELKKQIDAFGKNLKGEVKDNCNTSNASGVNAEQIILDSEALFKKHNETKEFEAQNACKLNSYTIIEDKKPTNCKETLRLGVIDIYAQKTIAAEKNGSIDVTPLSTISGVVVDLHKKGSVLQSEVQKYLFDAQISNEEKFELTMLYLENVVVAMRDLVVSARAYQRDEFNGKFFYEDLYISVPRLFFENLNDEANQGKRDKLQFGNNPGLDAWFFKFIIGKYARVQIVFDPELVFKRDLQTLLKAPTAKNYLLALKWLSLQMLMGQEAKYRSVLDLPTVVNVPNACRTHVNGSFPASFTFQVKENLLDQTLEELGLYYKSDEREGIFKQYFLDNANVDPLKAGYSGVLPFVEYETSKEALKNPNKYRDAFDDNNDSEEAQSILSSQVSQVMNGSINVPVAFRRYVSQNVKYRGSDLWEKIARSVNPDDAYFTNVNGAKTQFFPDRQNLSIFLAETIVRLQGTQIEDALSDQLKEVLKNTTIKLDLPSLFSSKVWRDWGLNLISSWASIDEISPNEERILNRMCFRPSGMLIPAKMRICSKPYDFALNKDARDLKSLDFKNVSTDAKGIKQNILKLIQTVKVSNEANDEVLTNSAVEDLTILSETYPVLQKLWNELRDEAQVLPGALTNEYSFLIDQLKSGNDWAKIRLGYLVAKDEMKNQKAGFIPSYTQKNGPRYTSYKVASSNTQCFYNNIDNKMLRIDQAAGAFGIDKPLSTKHISRILSEEQKIQLWQSNVDKTDETVNYLFNVKENGSESYHLMSDVSKQTLITKEDADDFIKKNNIKLDGLEEQKLDALHKSRLSELTTYFKSLYQLQGNPEKQKESLEAFIKEHGLDLEFAPKLGFLEVDNFNKMRIYRSLFKNAAKARMNKIQNQMTHICSMDADNVLEMRELFYSLSKNQNELNRIAKLPSVPKEVMESLEQWSEHESDSMWQGLTSGALLIGGVVVGGFCTVVTGGLCAPLAGALILTATGLQTNVAISAYDYYSASAKRESFANEMTELGHSTKDAASELHRSWGWTAFESLSVIPFIGPAGKFTSMTVRIATRATRTMVKGTGEALFTGASKLAAQETDVILAKHVLGQETLGKAIVGEGNLYERFLVSVEKLKMGQISMNTFLKSTGSFFATPFKAIWKEGVTQVVVLESAEQVNRQTAKVVSAYFGENASSMLNILKSYTGPRLTHAVEVMAKVKAGDTVAQNWMKLFKGGIIQTPAWLLTKFRELRYAHLAKHAAVLLKVEKELAEVVAKNGNLEEFVMKNMDDLTEIFMEIPMRKRELPYMILLQGGPHMGGLFGRRIPYLGQLADGILLRKIFNARARLVYESIKAEARASLGLSAVVGAEVTLKVVKAFNASVFNATLKQSGVSGVTADMAKSYEQFQEEAATLVYQLIGEKKLSRQLTIALSHESQKIVLSRPEVLKQILFNPRNTAEKAISEMLWEQMPIEKLLKLGKVSELAHMAMMELKNYKNIDEFESFYKSLVILILKKNPAAVEIM
jgi:hypothetical protein